MHTTTISLLLAIALSTPFASALPHWPQLLHHRSSTTTSTTTSPLTLPTSTLPAPASSLALKYIALGLGTQNYWCPASTPSSTISTTTTTSTGTPISIGAVATLYNATHLFTTTATLGSTALSILQCGITCLADSLNAPLSLPQLGHHYFDALGRPTFDLGSSGFLSAKKIAAVPAPDGACAGRNAAGAVDWLQLSDNGAGLSRGVSVVYRVETAGGLVVEGGCAGREGLVVVSDYAALYWFYG